MGRIWAVLGVIALLMAAFALPAGAHGVSDTVELRLAQSIAGNELTAVVRRTPTVPGPLNVDLIAHEPVRRTSVEVGLIGAEQRVQVQLDRRGTHSVALYVDRSGAWELLMVAATGERAKIPFRVMVPRLTVWEPVAYGGMAASGLFMAGALICAVFVRRRIFAGVQAGAGVVALTVAVTAALLSSTIPPAEAEGAIPADPLGGRPYVNSLVSTDGTPETGREFALRLSFTDGNTGRPADDFVAHHDALAHAVVTSMDGQFFRHVHPIRTAPGELAVRLTVDRPGKYLVHAEFERFNSGSQLVTGSFEATGADLGTPPVSAVRTIEAVAGRGVTIDVGVGGKADLQPWLGMAGHLVLRDQGGGFFGHVHEMSSMTTGQPPADETVASLKPDLRFTFTFPRAGRYLGWVQYQRNFTVSTVRLTVDVR
jgi:hypothetical protein